MSGLGTETRLGSSVEHSLALDGGLRIGVRGRTGSCGRKSWCSAGGNLLGLGGGYPDPSMSSKDGGDGLSSGIHATQRLTISL
jgi:hypothetical protein